MDAELVKLAFRFGFEAAQLSKRAFVGGSNTGALHLPPALRTRIGFGRGGDSMPWLQRGPGRLGWHDRTFNPVGTGEFLRSAGLLSTPYPSGLRTRFNPLGTGLPKWHIRGLGVPRGVSNPDPMRRYLLM